ncbi:MAG: hypothetical protein KF703_06645 [Actinobacteria bacterium]|nr:hypothetical protein [Actinomycetota bacterium]
MELGMFDQVADAVRGLVPADLGSFHAQARRWGLKAWFDADECPKVHYEAQVISPKHVAEAEHLAVEIGFHAEHPKGPANEEVLAPLRAAEAAWRPELGPQATLGPFLGNRTWLRLSETWPDPDLSDPEVCFEIADTLAAYVMAVEPLRTDRS